MNNAAQDQPDSQIRLLYEWRTNKPPEKGWHRSSTGRTVEGQRICFPQSEHESVEQAGLEYNPKSWWRDVGGESGHVAFLLEIGLAGPAAWAGVASVIRTYLTRHKYRKVVIYYDGKPVIEVSGDVTTQEIEALLRTQLPSNPDQTGDAPTVS